MSQQIHRTASLDLQRAVLNHKQLNLFISRSSTGKTQQPVFVWRIRFKKAHVYHDASKQAGSEN
jgi:hypothetical protein